MKHLLLLLFVPFFIACTANKKDEIKIIKDEVMTLHDEAMSKMGELRSVRKSLELKSNSIMEDTEKAEMITSKFSKTTEDIANANEEMMHWMHSFKPEFEGTDEEVVSYFREQKKAIEEVKKMMSKSLLQGKKILEN